MFCSKCGKDIGDAKYCPYCGAKAGSTIGDVNNQPRSVETSGISQFGHGTLIKLLSVVGTIINLVIRYLNSEIEVVYNLFAQDDYYVLSEDARIWMLLVMAAEILLLFALWHDAKNKKIKISVGSIICFILLLAVQIAVMLLRIPAPY